MVDKQAQNGYIGSEQLNYRTSNITQSGERASERVSAEVQAKKKCCGTNEQTGELEARTYIRILRCARPPCDRAKWLEEYRRHLRQDS